MNVLHAAAVVVAPWAALYQKSVPVQTGVLFVHLTGLVIAAGFAVATDRLTLRALRGGFEDRMRQLGDLASVHCAVLIGLSLSVASGLLMFAADLETLGGSWIFWGKIGLLALLLGNGFRMTRIEAALRRFGSAAAPEWRGLGRAAIASIALWFGVLFMGTLLPAVS